MKMTEFRSRQPLNDDDFAAIRRNVMTTIAAKKERRLFPIVMRFALAAAVVVAIGIALVPRRRGTQPTQQLSSRATQQPIIHQPVMQQPITRQPGNLATQQLTNPTRLPILRRHHHRTPHIELAKQNIRVEFRTSDPDVRIIWIANQTPYTTTGGKS
jgi:hypothetical protein